MEERRDVEVMIGIGIYWKMGRICGGLFLFSSCLQTFIS